jgi:maltose O-acetyltransferase
MVENVDRNKPSVTFNKMVSGKAYRPDKYCSAMTRRGEDLIQVYTQQYRERDKEGMKKTLTGLLGAVGEDVTFRPPLNFDYGVNTFIGDHCFFNYGAMILDVAEVRIGDFFMAGPNVQFLTPTHPLNPEDRQALWEGGQPITIGNNVWAGGGVIFCPGITVGDNCVIGAGSVVTKDIPAHSVAVGNPARVIKTVTADDRPAAPHQFSAEALAQEEE